MKKRYNIILTPEIHEEAKKFAELQNRSLSNYIETLISKDITYRKEIIINYDKDNR